MSQPQIVINIQGGVIQEVFCSGPLAELTVVDWDTEPGDEGVTEVVHRGETLRAHVVHPIIVPLHRLTGSEIEAMIEAAGEREAAGRCPGVAHGH